MTTIKRPKVALFTDLHLGLYSNSPEWHKVALKWADWIVSELTKKKIDDILFLGDWFHNRTEIEATTLQIAAQILDKFKKFNLFMIVGNHDAYFKNRADVHSLGLMAGHENITVIDKPLEFSAYEKKIGFIPWNGDLDTVGDCDYLFGHFETQTFKMNNHKVCDHGWNPSDYFKKAPVVFSGHFHNRSSKKYKEGTIHYIGNTFPMDFADVDNVKGYHILDVETGDLEFVENTVSPKFKKILLSDIKSITKSDISGNVVKIIVDIDIEDAKVEKLKSTLQKHNPQLLLTEFNVTSKVVNNVEEIDSIDLEEMFNEFIVDMKLDKDQEARVKVIMDQLYAVKSV